MTFEEWYTEHRGPDGDCAEVDRHQARLIWDAAVQAERERCAAICERIEEKQDRDNGAANTGGAAECAAAIRGQS